MVGDDVRAEDIAGDDAGLFGLGEVGCAGGEDGLAVVGLAVFCEEADEVL